MLDAALILCENCGYDIGSLEPRLAAAPDLKCPECGKPIAESLPERRVGSPWQRMHRVRSWLATSSATLRHPVTAWSTIRAHEPSSNSLLVINVLVATTITLLFMPRPVSGTDGYFHVFPSVQPIAAPFVTLGLLVASVIERKGIALFGWRRKWRISAPVASAIVGHASIGWVVGMCLGWLGWWAWIIAAPRPPHILFGVQDKTLILLLPPALLGLLMFETLVYLGFRAMRFANHPRESAP